MTKENIESHDTSDNPDTSDKSPTGNIEQLTDQCVKSLNDGTDSEMRAWVNQGKLVHDYVQSVESATNAPPDPYKKLAEHPESVHQATQLRNYEACYRLYVDFGGESGAPKVSMTHFVLVLGRKLNLGDRQRYLKIAEEEKLSVSQLKTLMAKDSKIASPDPDIDLDVDNDPDSKTEVQENEEDADGEDSTGNAGDADDEDDSAEDDDQEKKTMDYPEWNAEVKKLKSLTDKTFAQLCHINLVKKDKALPTHVIDSLNNLVCFLIENKLVKPEKVGCILSIIDKDGECTEAA